MKRHASAPALLKRVSHVRIMPGAPRMKTPPWDLSQGGFFIDLARDRLTRTDARPALRPFPQPYSTPQPALLEPTLEKFAGLLARKVVFACALRAGFILYGPA